MSLDAFQRIAARQARLRIRIVELHAFLARNYVLCRSRRVRISNT